jgi:hypothetical protein
MRNPSTLRVVKTLLGLFIVGLAVTTLFFMALAVKTAVAGPDKATVTLRYHTMSVRGQVARFKDAAATIRRLKREKHALQLQVNSKKLQPLGAHWLERSFLCIYGGESAGLGWGVNTGNGYYGGLQMDRQFQATYGPEFLRAWGTANNWPISVQLAVGMRAYLSGRGFHPWPNTSRACGLL